MSRPWMPLYVADYLADTAHLNAAESGAYLHLIMHYWQKGRLPIDDQLLARVARLNDQEWIKAKPVLAEFFYGEWQHKRVEEELARSAEVSAKRSAASRSRKSNGSSIDDQLPNKSTSEDDTRGRVLQSQPQKDDAALNASARSELDGLERKLRDASGLQQSPSPALFDLSPILGLVDAGFDLETEILPTIRAKARPNVGSWKFFVQACHDSRATRQAAATGAGHSSARAPPADRRNKVFEALELNLAAMK